MAPSMLSWATDDTTATLACTSAAGPTTRRE